MSTTVNCTKPALYWNDVYLRCVYMTQPPIW
jgi:hypothetical protein